MVGLLLLLALQAKPEGPYDSDPAHLWNRIHRGIHTWSGANREPGLDADGLHWPDELRSLSDEPQLGLLPLLDEFLSKKGEDLVRDPVRRAVLQRDLWMIFEASVGTSRMGEVWDRRKREPAPVDLAAHRELRARIVSVLRRVALGADQIRALPDTCAAASKLHPGIPADLLDPKGPWVALSDAAGGPLARAHLEFFGGRAAFLILLRTPGGRKATEEYAKALGEAASKAPECPPDTRVALVRQSLLISDRGLLSPSPITESVSLRTLRPGRESEDAKFTLRRGDLFAGKGGGLAPADLDHSFVLLLGHNKESGRGKVVQSCRECHASSSITSLETVVSIRRPGRAIVIPSTLEDETWRVHGWCFERHSFGLLKAAWPE